MLRVIAGELGGRRLRAPPGLRTRPTTDRVREALFNILGPPPPSARVLDLYAGSGALGIEALSRGAAQAIFVEQDARVCRQISDNLASLGLSGRGQVRCGRVLSLVPQLVQNASRIAPFDWVFADPPYDSDELPALLAQLCRLPLLSADAQIIVERSRRDSDSLAQQIVESATEVPLRLTDSRRYGDTALLFFSLTPPGVQPTEGP